MTGDLHNAATVRPAAAPPAVHGMVGRSPRMREVYAQIGKVAASDATVCITGERGTGKELVARGIHEASARRKGPLMTLDCTTIPEGLMETQLFGHVRGAFTGAVNGRDGVFELANHGTLFIDELGELPLTLQGKLLRVIQTRQVVKVGGGTPVQTNVRLVTATNRRLEQAVADGSFREDLYYRISVVKIRLPALRERREDIPLLVDHFCRRFSALYGKSIAGVAPAALRRLVRYEWPGNVRELENVLERAFVLAESDTLTEADLFGDDALIDEGAEAFVPSPLEPASHESLYQVEKTHILRTLDRVRGNRTEAARVLGISRRCLQYRLKAYRAEGEPATAPSSSPALRVVG